MSEGKHTPGPYEIGQHGILNEDGEALFVTGSDGTVWWQNAADAHLFAASPAMFKALTNLLAMLDSYADAPSDTVSDERWHFEVCPARDAARAALSSASTDGGQ